MPPIKIMILLPKVILSWFGCINIPSSRLRMGNTSCSSRCSRGRSHSHPCERSLSPHPWGSPPYAASPSQGVSTMLRQQLFAYLCIQIGFLQWNQIINSGIYTTTCCRFYRQQVVFMSWLGCIIIPSPGLRLSNTNSQPGTYPIVVRFPFRIYGISLIHLAHLKMDHLSTFYNSAVAYSAYINLFSLLDQCRKIIIFNGIFAG